MKKLLPKTSTNTQGFTLVELLVVISIIAILAVIGVTVYSGVQKNARDARRKADIDAIASALESQKSLNTTTYNALLTTNFSGAGIPTDTTTAQYSIAWAITTGAASPAIPTAWAATVATPTLPAIWAVVGNATTAGAGTVSTANPPATATAWTVCALLENGTNPTVYCKSNAQ